MTQEEGEKFINNNRSCINQENNKEETFENKKKSKMKS